MVDIIENVRFTYIPYSKRTNQTVPYKESEADRQKRDKVMQLLIDAVTKKGTD